MATLGIQDGHPRRQDGLLRDTRWLPSGYKMSSLEIRDAVLRIHDGLPHKFAALRIQNVVESTQSTLDPSVGC